MAKEKDNTPDVIGREDSNKEIDLLEVVYTLWSRKKFIILWCFLGIFVGAVIAFSIPREYTTQVTLAPETAGSPSIGGSLGALASMAGISAGNSGPDAVYPTLYPDVVSSIPFMTSLFDVPVTDNEGNMYTVKEYLKDETKSPWWGVILGFPGKMLGKLKGDQLQDASDLNHFTDNFRLTLQEDKLVQALKGRVTVNVDQKTDVITITTKMQDPMVSAILADTVVVRLRDYITDYRTNKARKDLEYAETLNVEAQQEYYKAQQKLADYIDRNQNLATRTAQVTKERLENETTLAFNLYNETSLHVQAAKSRVQETTPVYTEITPATVPLRPSAPRKILILVAFTFLAFAGSAAWVIFGSPILKQYRQKVKEIKEGENKDNTDNKYNNSKDDGDESDHDMITYDNYELNEGEKQ